jgi:hypothetical protein
MSMHQDPKAIRACLLMAHYTPCFVTADVMNTNICDLTVLNIGEFFSDSFMKYDVVDYEMPVMKGTVDVYHDPVIALKDGKHKTFLLIPRTCIKAGKEIDRGTLAFFARLLEAYVTCVPVFKWIYESHLQLGWADRIIVYWFVVCRISS